ncbi:35406_t:CDS:2 [Gigaspora margarita]|uniref:35406_t:CDS:1 n=1 Tax=Gigaspora margarita TaxID=4874 RepID=A0ABN7V1J7_GIGMA|nr:35406_t:CDS:2 [Gigaspora margarita]
MTEQNSTNRKKKNFYWILFENFENVEEIGKGAFSTVFKTKYYGSYEEVAIKLVKDSNKKNREPLVKEVLYEVIYELNQWLKIIGYEVTVFEPYIKSGVENKNKQLKIIEDEVRNKLKVNF